MVKTIRADFFRVNVQDFEGDFSTLLERVVSLPDNDESRVVEIRQVPFRLQSSVNTQGIWEGELVRIRMTDVPVVASLTGELEQLELEDDEGIGEETAFLYHQRTRVLILQRNRLGVSAANFARYFSKLLQLDATIFCDPILAGDAFQRLKEMRLIKKFELRVSGIDKMNIFSDKKLGVEEVIALQDKFCAPNISIELSVGNRRDISLIADRIKQTAKSFLGFSNDHDGQVRKIEISGKYEDNGPTEVIDLLEYWIREEIPIDPANSRFISYSERLAALYKAWDKRSSELLSIFDS
jgi:hypothetical protein